LNEYPAVVVRWKDGDTLVAHLDQGFHDWKHDQSLRLVGIQAPDKHPAKEKARAFVNDSWPPGTKLVVRTIRDKFEIEQTTFERWLAEAWADGVNISDAIVDAGHAVKWDGKGKRPDI
jgi:endonuclease YncB( thermonuclease family)